MRASGVYAECIRLLLIVALGALVGSRWGQTVAGIAVALFFFACWHLRQAARLLRWLGDEQESAPPESAGIWAVIFDRLYHRQRSARRERERLELASQTIREASSSISDVVLMVDAKGAIIWCNLAANGLLGIAWPVDGGQLLVNLLRNPRFVRYFQRGDYDEPLEMKSPHDSQQVLRFEIKVYGEANRMLLVRDITKISRLEKMRVDFIANVSHELRTPLTVINGYLETLRGFDGEVPPQALDRGLAQMQVQSRRMEALVNDLTTLSRLESEPESAVRQTLDVASLVAQLIDDASGAAQAAKRFHVDVQSGVLLQGQEREIHSAFGNLVNNACKYTAVDGEIRICWRLEQRRAVFEVRDNGEGIDVSHLPRLTERFYRVDRSRSIETGGTGLGLAIVKHVLMRHQAQLEIESTPGEGSVFRCVFPVDRIESRVV